MNIKEYFESIKQNKAKLRQFMFQMPKGGDLHNHLTGAAYPELYFEIACKNGLYVDMNTGKLYSKAEGGTIQMSFQMEHLHTIRMTLIDKWSIRNFQPYKYALGPDEYFFGEFGLFGAATSDDVLPDILHELKVRAKAENVQYLETMGISPKISANAYLSEKDYKDYSNSLRSYCSHYSLNPSSFDQMIAEVLYKIVTEYENQYKDTSSSLYKDVQSYVERNKNIVGADRSEFLTSRYDTTSVSADDVTVRLQGYASRGGNPVDVFAQLYIVHKAMTIIPDLLVGCNIVAAENSENSMLYYRAHMMMFQYLSAIQINGDRPNTALHAGELTIGLIRPEHLTYHIKEAIFTANAKRIGHGVDIAFEQYSKSIINNMKSRDVAVEINLTSNEFILGVKEDAHPFSIYKDNGVPLVICTDDPGILRTSLTEEYAIAAYRYQLSYDDVKELVLNSIKYSFLDDETKEKQMTTLKNRITQFENQWPA